MAVGRHPAPGTGVYSIHVRRQHLGILYLLLLFVYYVLYISPHVYIQVTTRRLDQFELESLKPLKNQSQGGDVKI